MKRNILLMAAALVLIVGVAACGLNPTADTNNDSDLTTNTTPTTSTNEAVLITEQQATAIVENMLNGYNTGDYATFSRDLTPEVKTVITEDLFQQFVTESKATLGQFKSIKAVEQGESNGTSSTWVVTIEFENSTGQFTFTFNQATGQIEGMNFGPGQ